MKLTDKEPSMFFAVNLTHRQPQSSKFLAFKILFQIIDGNEKSRALMKQKRTRQTTNILCTHCQNSTICNFKKLHTMGHDYPLPIKKILSVFLLTTVLLLFGCDSKEYHIVPLPEDVPPTTQENTETPPPAVKGSLTDGGKSNFLPEQ